MPKRTDNDEGASARAEGQHGDKTHSRFIEQLHEGPSEEPLEERLERDRERAGREGKRRLVEDREQHDEAEKNSEQARASRDGLTAEE